MQRRELFERTIGVTGLAALLAACGADLPDAVGSMPTETSTTVRLPVPELEVDEWAFARPWKSVIDADLIVFGSSVLSVAPETVAIARGVLGVLPEGSTLIARDKLFAECCRKDSRAGDVVVVDGWMVPTTLAGLAGALSQFKS
jgi:hypothetical protein